MCAWCGGGGDKSAVVGAAQLFVQAIDLSRLVTCDLSFLALLSFLVASTGTHVNNLFKNVIAHKETETKILVQECYS